MQHEYHHVPVTALALHSHDILLAGQGNYIVVYDRSRAILLTIAKVFDNQAVHGIVLNTCEDDRGLIYGGRLIRHFRLSSKDETSVVISLGELVNTKDWILDAAFSPSSTCAALINAHNALWLTSYSEEENEASVNGIERVVPGSNCILYCAHVKWLSASHCLVASGTAFGDVILWSTFFNQEEGGRKVFTETHFTFSAHNGSVFGVQISPLSKLPGTSATDKRVLATCSDDRQIKLWNVSDLSVQSPTLTQIQRDTGFGSLPDDSGVAPQCLAQIMGHVSRIWHVRFASMGSDGTLDDLRSFGEDASVITWRIKPNDAGVLYPYALNKSHVASAHAGKNIWTTALDQSGTMATGGADGAMTLSTCSVPAEEIEAPLGLLNSIHSGDRFKVYSFVAANSLIATTEHGALVMLNLHASGMSGLTQISSSKPDLKGYSIVESMANLAFAAGTDGSVYMYEHKNNKTTTVVDLPRKATGLFLGELDQGTIALLVISVGGNIGRLLFIDDNHRMKSELGMALPTGFVATSFACKYLGQSIFIILGSRSGSLAIYSVEADASPELAMVLDRRDLVHGKDAITALQCTSLMNEENETWIFSTGRDGTLAIHALDMSSGQYDLCLVHQLALPFGPNVEGLRLFPADEVWAWGFKSTHFIVHDVVNQREVMTVECGGAHRTWAFHPDTGGGTFVWTKASKVSHTKQNQLPYKLMNQGGHGREIKSVSVFSPAGGNQIIATGAEDTNIKLFRLENGRFKCLQTLRKHNTGIQHLQWSTDGRYLFSSGGFEEFFVWKITPDVPYVDIGVVCESPHPRSGKSDLRIMGFDARQRAVDEFAIYMGYSDSTVKVWRYGNSLWECVASAGYATSCLTHVLSCPWEANCLWTTATDGHIAVWFLGNHSGGKQTLDRISRHKIHQSAIHAVTSQVLPDCSVLLVTGGDDNAVSVTRISTIDSSMGRAVCNTLRIPRAHAAAVTGLAFIRVDEERSWLASTALDQRVKLWEISVNCTKPGVEGVDVRLIQNAFTAVADVSGLEVCRLKDGGTGLLVCGVGMDVWRLPQGSRPADEG